MIKGLITLLVVIVLLVAAFATGWIVARTGMGSSVAVETLSERERQFSEQMSGSSLVGRFTIAGREEREALAERYDLSSVEKVGENSWRFNARMRYGSVDTTLPVVVPMRWLDDTPVITLTDYSIPGLGTFSARVFFHGDRYAGTWQHGKVGGHMYGRIEKQK
jgi:hypothetical protein